MYPNGCSICFVDYDFFLYPSSRFFFFCLIDGMISFHSTLICLSNACSLFGFCRMGLSSTSTSSEGLRLCIFDLRRGQQEGQELDKILFFFPFDTHISARLSLVGLSEGLITFTR